MFGSLVLVAIVNPYFLIMVGIMSILFMILRRIFLKSSKNIKRLEGISKFIAYMGKLANILRFYELF